ncbi:hypothetical protein BTVI_145404 [Pitangus sulphuratus]|nr:hypothetical protein BTVI_145404 [Pitangus sulphuratus]
MLFPWTTLDTRLLMKLILEGTPPNTQGTSLGHYTYIFISNNGHQLDPLEDGCTQQIKTPIQGTSKICVQNNPRHEYRLGEGVIESNFAQKDLEVLMDEKLNMNQQYALTTQKTNCILGHIKRGVASRSVVPLLCHREAPSEVLHPGLGSSAEERHQPIRVDPEEGHKDDQKDGAPLLQRKAERGGVVQHGEKKTSGRPHCGLPYLKGAYKKEGEELFKWADSYRTRGNGFKLKESRFRLDDRKKFFTQRVVKYSNRLPREVVDTPPLEVFQGQVGWLCNLI